MIFINFNERSHLRLRRGVLRRRRPRLLRWRSNGPAHGMARTSGSGLPDEGGPSALVHWLNGWINEQQQLPAPKESV